VSSFLLPGASYAGDHWLLEGEERHLPVGHDLGFKEEWCG
jgi:hypothetical protein